MKLVKDATGEEVKIGETLRSIIGDMATVVGWEGPIPIHDGGMPGFVVVDFGSGCHHYRYPSYFNTHFEEE